MSPQPHARPRCKLAGLTDPADAPTVCCIARGLSLFIIQQQYRQMKGLHSGFSMHSAFLDGGIQGELSTHILSCGDTYLSNRDMHYHVEIHTIT